MNCPLTSFVNLFTIQHGKIKRKDKHGAIKRMASAYEKKSGKKSEGYGWRLGDPRPDTKGNLKSYFFLPCLALISSLIYNSIRDIKAALYLFTNKMKKCIKKMPSVLYLYLYPCGQTGEAGPAAYFLLWNTPRGEK